MTATADTDGRYTDEMAPSHRLCDNPQISLPSGFRHGIHDAK